MRSIHQGNARHPAAPELYTVAELSERWRCHAESLRRRIRQGTLPAMRIGGKHLIAAATIERMEQAAAVRPPIKPPGFSHDETPPRH